MNASIERAIWCASRRLATWSSSAAGITRSRFAAIASNWARSRASCVATPGCVTCVVVPHDDGAGARRLVAYIVCAGPVPPVTELREFCGRVLPGYMVPSVFVGVGELPLSGNGKVDRGALPGVVVGRAVGVSFVAPRSELEWVVAGVWGEVLGVSRVGVLDDFFVLGGHSLLAMRVVARVLDVCGVRLGVRVLFDAPTVAGFAELVAAARSADVPRLPAPVARDRQPGQLVAASAAQVRIWFTEQWYPGTAMNNIPVVLRLHGRVKVDALARSFDELVLRHESLRTVLPTVDGVPWQRVLPPSPSTLPVTDLRGSIDPKTPANDVPAVRALVNEPFDLANGPLYRSALMRLADDEYLLVMAVHHAVADGWSIGLILTDLARAYAALADGSVPAPAAASLRYADFALWQEEALTAEVVGEQVAFWRGQLAGSADLRLPGRRGREASAGNAADGVPVVVPAAVVARLEELARHCGATLFMVLLAAYQVLLGRYAGQRQFAVGTVTAGRSRVEFDGVVGFFVNTVPIRADLGGRPSFTELVGRVRQRVLDVFAYQDVPFDRLVAELVPDRTPGVPPVFQACFTLENTGGEIDRFGAIPVSEDPCQVDSSWFDLTLNLTVRGGELRGGLLYSTTSFDRSFAEQLVRGFAALIDDVLDDPDRDVDRLSLLDGITADTIADMVSGECPNGDRAGLHEPIRRWADRTPHAIALVAGTRTVTFGALDVAAETLATEVLGHGIGPERIVALCLPRGVETAIAMLAVLYAGAAYLPIDPDLPDERIRYLLADSSAALVVTTAEYRDRIERIGGWPVHVVSSHLAAAESGRPRPVRRPVDPDTPAYVLYTSGSTGEPKGVVVTHAAIDNRLRWMQHNYRLGRDDRVLHKTPTTFDVSVWEIFWPLREGVPLVIAEPGGHRDPRYLAELIRREHITTVHFVPAMLEVFLREDGVGDSCATLRRVICSGERLSPETVTRFRAVSGAALDNLYGPTEAAVDVTYWPCPEDFDGAVLIGRPVWHTRVHVLDDELHQVPPWVAGELYLAGVQLARGYLNRPGLTADRFIPDPFQGGGSRMYRTGDVVRWTGDGQLDYLGRSDDQMKIRGQRLEPGEIEAHLARHPAVAAAAVVARADEHGDSRLVAFVVPDPVVAFPALNLLRLDGSGRLAGYQRHVLPGGLTMIGPNRGEVEFLYREIFERREYLRHGVRLGPGAVVFDVGAHIGMFATFVARSCPDSVIHAFEPIPELYDMLALNTEIHQVDARAYNCGLAAEPGTATFTYYPQLSILSTRFGREAEERAAVTAYAGNQLAAQPFRETADDLAPFLDELLTDRLAHRPVDCELRTVSDIIAERGVTRIDLLKIDAEKSELEVLRGVSNDHWPIIRQVVAEVHDIDDRLALVTELLECRGFTVTVETSQALGDTGLVVVYAVRGEATGPDTIESTPDIWCDPDELLADIRQDLARVLPGYMVPSVFVGVGELPLSGNGKVDRGALPGVVVGRAVGVSFVAPRSELEWVVAGVWGEVLGVSRVGVLDDFFVLGGHSLLAMRVVARVLDVCGVRLGVRALFDAPTVAGFAELVAAARSADDAPQPAPVRHDRADYLLSQD